MIIKRFSGSLYTELHKPCRTSATLVYDFDRHMCSVMHDVSPSPWLSPDWEFLVPQNLRITDRDEFVRLATSDELAARVREWAGFRRCDYGFEKWGDPSLGEGEYRPRISRPHGPKPGEVGTAEELLDAWVAFRALEQSILDVFNVLHPSPGNDPAHGHRIRELLILCCTEVELLLADAAKANQLQPDRRDYTMKDYVKLSAPLCLPEWTVTLLHYPYPPLVPFDGWVPGVPGSSLSWYQDYNKVKHQRREHFEKATLENLLKAAAAVAVLIAAEFGDGLELKLGDNHRIFRVHEPEWDIAGGYVPPATGQGWVAKPLFPSADGP